MKIKRIGSYDTFIEISTLLKKIEKIKKVKYIWKLLLKGEFVSTWYHRFDN